MAGTIAAIEDEILAHLREIIGRRVREIDSLPGPFSAELLRRIFQNAPAVYVVWLGGPLADTGETTITARLDVVMVTKNARGERSRRRGDARTIGAYDLIETVAAALHEFQPVAENAGELRLKDASNLFNEAVFDTAATVYVAKFEVATTFPVAAADPATLEDFLHFHADWDLGPAPDGDYEATDDITLTGASDEQ